MLDRAILDELRAAVDGPDGVQAVARMSGLISTESQLQTYECDGLTNFRVMPGAVVLPRSAEQVQAVVRICARHQIPFVGRGAGTGLSGGALPDDGRHRDQLCAHEPHPGDRHSQPARRGGAGRDQRARDAAR